MVDNKDGLVRGRSDLPSTSEEFNRVRRADAAWDVQSEMEVEQFFFGQSLEFGASFGQRLFPSLIRCQPGRAVSVILVVVFNFVFEELIGVIVVTHFLVRKQGDQALLERAKETLDLAFGLR